MRGCDLAEGLMASGRTGEAKASVANAIALGPRVRPVVRRSATLFDALGDRRQAVTLMSRELHQTGADAGALFDWFVERRIPSADVLAGLSNDARALPAYLRYLMLPGTCPDAERAWHALLAHHPEPRLAGDYVNFVRNECYRPDDADRAWTEYAKLASPGYQVSDWVFNGDFNGIPRRCSSTGSGEGGAAGQRPRSTIHRSSRVHDRCAWYFGGRAGRHTKAHRRTLL